MFEWIGQNTLIAGVMALVVGAACALLRPRPALAHVLWGLVLLRLVAPPVPAPARVDAVGAARQGVAAAAAFVEAQYQEAIADPEEAFRRAERKRRVMQAQFARGQDGKGEREGAEPADLCEAAFAEMAFAAGAEAPATPGGGEVTIREALGVVWGAGSAVMAVWLVTRAIALRRLVRRARPGGARLNSAVAQVAERLGMALPRVLVTDELVSPVVWALGRPALLWPSGGTSGSSALLQQSSVIAHELAHIRRRDHWMVWLELGAMVALWWNPVMWAARSQMRRSAELACDAWAVSHYPGQRRSYAETLVTLCAGRAAPGGPVGAIALGAGGRRGAFERRLRLIMRSCGGYRAPRAVTAMLGAVSLLAVSPGRPAVAPAPDVEVVEVDAAIPAGLRPAVERSILARRARLLFEVEDWPRAAAAYQAMIDRCGPDGEALSRLGAARLMEGRTADAIAAFAAQCELNYRRDVGEFNLGAAHGRAGNLDEAVRCIERAVSIGFDDLAMLQSDPDLEALRPGPAMAELIARVERAADLRGRAQRAMRQGAWPEAAALWGEVLELTPADARAIHLLGVSQIAAGAPREAIETYDRLLGAGAMVKLAAYNAACAAALAGEGALAIRLLDRAVEAGFRDGALLAGDGDLSALHGMDEFVAMRESLLARERLRRAAAIALEHRDWGGAEEAAGSLLALEPGSGWAWAGLGEARLGQGDGKGAAEAFGRQVALGHDVASGLFSRARALAAQGRAGEAISHLAAAIDAGFSDGRRLASDASLARLREHEQYAHVERSLADAEVLGRFGAVNWVHLLDRSRRLAERLPRDGRVQLRLGWAHLRLGAHEAAISAFAEQERLGFAPGIARYNVACALALGGRTDEALDWLEASLEAGFADAAHAAADLDLRSLHGLEGFDAYLARARGLRRMEGPDRMVY